MLDAVRVSARARQQCRRLAFVGLALGVLSGCGVRTDAAPRDVPEPMRELIISGQTGNDAAGADRIFLVGPGDPRLLRSVQREASSRENLMQILMLGPNEAELADQFSTVIPPDTEVLSVRSQGSVLIVDLSDQITDLTGGSLTQAIAQIVFTASEIDGVEAVQIEIDGQPKAWQKANGEASFEALRTYDYPGYVQTAQPAYPVLGDNA